MARKGIMYITDKENVVGAPEKALKDCLYKFEVEIKDALTGLDYETAFVTIDKLSNKLNSIVSDILAKMKSNEKSC